MSRLFRILLGMVGAIAIVFAALAVREQMKPVTRSFPVRYLSGPEAADILSGHIPPGAVQQWTTDAVFVRGHKNDFETVATILQREDKPKPQVKLRFQIIEADGFTTKDPSIARVEDALRQLFRFEGYKLVAEAYTQSRAESEASQTIIGADGVQYMIELKVDDVMRRGDKASAEITVQLWAPSQHAGAILNTAVQVPDGQTVVLGTARVDKNRGALILVVTPEIR